MKANSSIKFLLFTLLLASGLFTSSIRAAQVDYFLKLDGVDGESTDDHHRGEIHVESFSWGVSQAGSSGGSAGGAGKAIFSDMTFHAPLSKASPKLMLACATGQFVRSATLVGRRSDGGTNSFMKVVLEDVYVTSYQIGGSGVEGAIVPTDQLSLNFTKITFHHTAMDGTVTSAEAVRPVLQ